MSYLNNKLKNNLKIKKFIRKIDYLKLDDIILFQLDIIWNISIIIFFSIENSLFG